MQLELESHFMDLAKSTGQKCVLVCDRGLLDGSAYVSSEKWDEMCKAKGIDRYGGVY